MTRRRFTAAFKTKVVLEALKERETLSTLARKYKLHPQQITNWKNLFISNSSSIFAGKGGSKKTEAEEEREKMLRTIGELKLENDFLKKRLQ